MSSHKACCILGICCPPKKQAESLAHMIDEAGTPEAAAQAILEVADLVPKGVGAAMVAGLRPMFKAGDEQE